jgi:hypothetical protein
MTQDDREDLSPEERFSDIPRILRALRQATRRALWEHKQLGYPVAVWTRMTGSARSVAGSSDRLSARG